MAIVKGSYTKEKAGAKAAVRYIAHRPGKDGAKITRTLFGNDGVMTRSQAYRMIDAAQPGTYFYRLAISPDPATEDTNKDIHLWDITDQTMTYLAEQLQTDVLYVAAEHNDHAPHRHVHVIALLPQRLTKHDLTVLRTTATEAALVQRHARDRARAIQGREQEEEQGWDQ